MQGFGCSYLPACQEYFRCDCLRKAATQPCRSSSACDHPPTGLRQSKTRCGRRYSHVTGQRKFTTTSKRYPVDCGNYRLARQGIIVCEATKCDRIRIAFYSGAQKRKKRWNVRACGECFFPGSRKDQYSYIAISREATEQCTKRLIKFWGDSIEFFRPIYGYSRNATFCRDQYFL